LNIFPKLTVFQNVQAAVIAHKREGLNLFRAVEKYFGHETNTILERVDLKTQAEKISGSLSYGYQKQLELGIALACEPDLLLLDEPTAGMSPANTRDAASLIKHIVKEEEITLLVVEHDMEVVFSISDRIAVLYQGRVIKNGLPEEVRNDPSVQRIYLGEHQ